MLAHATLEEQKMMDMRISQHWSPFLALNGLQVLTDPRNRLVWSCGCLY